MGDILLFPMFLRRERWNGGEKGRENLRILELAKYVGAFTRMDALNDGITRGHHFPVKKVPIAQAYL